MNKKDDEDYIGKVKEWIESQGYPLELFVASLTQKASFATSISDYYQDPKSGEYREIDVTATRFPVGSRPVMAHVSFRIECKLSKEKPWVVFISDPATQADDFLFHPLTSICSDVFRVFLFETIKKADYRSRLLQLPLFRPKLSGHGVTQAFTTGRDEPYKALMSASNASIARALETDKIIHPMPNVYTCGIEFPVIILDGDLFVAYLDKKGKIELQKVFSSFVYWKGAASSLFSPIVPIVTKPALEQFIEDMSQTADGLLTISDELMDELTKIAKEVWQSKHTLPVLD